jgi:rhodanese-related sulfurtransferase
LENTTSISELSLLMGSIHAPWIVDVRVAADVQANPMLIPSSIHRDYDQVHDWAVEFTSKPIIVVCHKGLKLSHGVAAQLRILGRDARVLEGGFMAWNEAQHPCVPIEKIPERIAGKTLWVTRERPKVDRIACPWLIRRFIDPFAEFLFVEASQVMAVAERFHATPFDIEDVFWSHRGDHCTFDTMIAEFGLTTPTLATLAAIVRGADTAQLSLTPQSAGLLALSLGLSKMHQSDLAQLEAGMLIYDALFAWCSKGQDETHNWPARASL